MKGLFIPDITAKMFRSGCLESIEALMAKGEIYDIDYEPEQRWITSGKPMNSGMYLVTLRQKFEGEEAYGVRIMRFINGNWMLPKHFPEWINEEIEQEVLAWRELPESYVERREG